MIALPPDHRREASEVQDLTGDDDPDVVFRVMLDDFFYRVLFRARQGSGGCGWGMREPVVWKRGRGSGGQGRDVHRNARQPHPCLAHHLGRRLQQIRRRQLLNTTRRPRQTASDRVSGGGEHKRLCVDLEAAHCAVRHGGRDGDVQQVVHC